MNEYLYSLVLVAGAAAFSGFFAYSGSDKFYKFAAYAILFSAALIPLFSFFSYLRDFDMSDISGGISEDISDTEFEEVSKEAFLAGIKKTVAEREKISEDSVYVTLEGFSALDMRADRIEITLVGAGISVDYRELEDFIFKSGLGVCEVKYGFN